MKLLLLLFAQAPVESAPQPEPPNIVLAIADDLDLEHLGFCGNALARTPALDRLAAAGTVFSVLYAQPVCRPALATLLTGRWPHQTGIVSNLCKAHLDPTGALPARLRARGYATFCGGKFWEEDHHAFGFDEPAVQNEEFLRDEGQTEAELFRFLEAERGRPWFVWWAPKLPHTPHQPPASLMERFAHAEVSVPPYFEGSAEDYVDAERRLFAMDAWLDEEFARLLEKLEQLGEREQTLIVFLADNGWSTALPSKSTPFEKGVRSPLVFSVPAARAARAPRRVEALVDLVDVTATLLDYAGAADESAPGRSLRPWLEGGQGPSRELLCGAAYQRRTQGGPVEYAYALYARDARWKYVYYLKSLGPAATTPGSKIARAWHARAGKELLFDLLEDPLELRDLARAESQAERKRAMRAGVLEWWRTSGGGELTLPEER